MFSLHTRMLIARSGGFDQKTRRAELIGMRPFGPENKVLATSSGFYGPVSARVFR